MLNAQLFASGAALACVLLGFPGFILLVTCSTNIRRSLIIASGPVLLLGLVVGGLSSQFESTAGNSAPLGFTAACFFAVSAVVVVEVMQALVKRLEP
jgi:hypothetical protein